MPPGRRRKFKPNIESAPMPTDSSPVVQPEDTQSHLGSLRAALARMSALTLPAKASQSLAEALQELEAVERGLQRREQQIHALEAALQESVQGRAKFVSVVTHELRIPMTSIKGYTDLMLKGLAGPLNEMQTNFLQVIHNNVGRMSNLVSDLSDINRIESNRFKLDRRLMDLVQVVEEALQPFESPMQEKRQTLELDLEVGLPPVFADPARVSQAITHLVRNAHLYTPENGRITVRAAASGEMVRLEVEDTGAGISPADQERLFSQFFRSEAQVVRDQPGWGLGLHLTRLLVELMGGKIGYSSASGSGSRFWFTLPTMEIVRGSGDFS